MNNVIVIHHNDDDGRCAGAIVYHELLPVFANATPDDFYEYRYGYKLNVRAESIENCRDIYIVDVSIDNELLDFIQKVYDVRKDNMPNIVFIDHHQTSKDWLDEHKDDVFHVFMKYTKRFVRIGISGSLLTWLWSCMTEEERENIPPFDFTAGRTHLAINVGQKNQREYKIPEVVRYVDDWDVWIHDIPSTKYFNLGFGMEKSKHPTSEVWANAIYGDIGYLEKEYISKGRILWGYQNSLNARNLSRAFETSINGIKCLALNSTGNSMVFGNKVAEYPFVVLFYYDGVNKLWKYSFYSDETSGVDVSEIAKTFDGGGHVHASGCHSKKFIFDDEL